MPTTVESTEVQPKQLDQLEQVFKAHHDRVFRAAYRITGNATDAEDVLQTVFLRLLRHGHDLSEVEDPGSYLHRAGLNAALDLVRARRTAVPLDEMPGSAGPDGKWSPDRSHDSGQLREWLRKSITQLHPTSAEMFALRYFEGFDNGEIARMMNTSEGTVAVTLHRTRARLQKEIRTFAGEIR
ncbi:MAG TPA: RNA polymerase sigma factor [Bryobacteraceae bacterium]|nr:RNA polymerase sigma factor [Bryobacteraceae bacterium]